MDEASGEGRKDQKNKDDQLGCVDYRKYTFAQMIMIDDGLAERGLTLPLLMIMTVNVSMATCSFTSIFMSTQASVSLDNVRCFLLGISVSLSLFNQYVSRKGIARLRDFFETSMRSLRTGFPEERTIIDDARRAATSQLDMYVKIFACNNVVMMFVQPIGELMSGRSWKKLPIQWTFPPSDNEFSFWLIFLFQFTGLFFAHCVGVMTMSFTSITIQMTALFDVLVFSIGNIEKRAAARTQQTGSDYHAALLACLKDDVAHYQQLIRALSSITPYLRNTFLIVSAAVPMVMACEAYPIMQGNFSFGDLVKSFLFLTIQFSCWAQTCSRLETMTDRHAAVFNVLYDSPWCDTGAEYKKLVFNTLTFSTHPKYIKARLFNEVIATMATFYSFVMSSFNLLNMIRNIG